MSDRKAFGSMRRSWVTAAILAAAAACCLAVWAASASADSSCSSGHACVWPSKFFVGAKGESLCTGGAHGLAGSKESGKNSCANKAVWFRQNGTAFACLNPGGEAGSFTFPINEIWVGAEGSRC